MPAVLVTGAVEADWRDERSYDYTTGMTPRERAWEFLRRKPAFQRDVTAACQQANSWSYRPLLDVVASAGDLLRWGVLFAESYGRNSIVFWSPLWCVHVLPVIAEHLPASSETTPYELLALPCRATVLLAPGKGQHVLLRNAEHTLQLAVSGADILHPVCLRTEAIWPAKLLRHRLRALEWLNALSVGQRLPARLFPREKRGPRLNFVLRALDGSLAGASHRELAEALIGQRRVDDE